MVLTDRQAADAHASKAVSVAHQTMVRAMEANGGNLRMAFRNGLGQATRALSSRLIEIYAALDDAVVQATRDQLVASVTEHVCAFIQSSAATHSSIDPGLVARESATLIGSYTASIGHEFDLAVHSATQRRRQNRGAPTPVHVWADATMPAPREGTVIDLLLVVTTDVEHRALIDAWKSIAKSEQNPMPIHGARRTYDDLGVVAGTRIAIVQTQMGTSTVGGSLSTIKTALYELRPKTIIMVGIAFGIDESKQPIGTVLVSEKVHQYEIQRLGTTPDGEIVRLVRGDRATASPDVLSRLKNANRESPAQFGLLLSGEKLVDNRDYREQLREHEPEAIGGEMEGGGLYVAATEERCGWCIVKAVCDWADGKKGIDKQGRQQLAAQKAAEYAMRAIAAGGFAAKRTTATQVVPEQGLVDGGPTVQQAEALSDRLDALRHERVARIVANKGAFSLGAGALMLFHVLPLSSLDRAAQIDLSELKKLPMPLISLAGGGSPRINVDGYLLTTTNREGLGVGYVQVFRSGVVESVMSKLTEGNPPLIGSVWFEEALITAIRSTLQALNAIAVAPPYATGITLARVRNARLALSNTHRTNPIDRDVLFLPGVQIHQALLTPQEVATALRPAFDVAWQAAGEERSYNFDDAGKWSRR